MWVDSWPLVIGQSLAHKPRFNLLQTEVGRLRMLAVQQGSSDPHFIGQPNRRSYFTHADIVIPILLEINRRTGSKTSQRWLTCTVGCSSNRVGVAEQLAHFRPAEILADHSPLGRAAASSARDQLSVHLYRPTLGRRTDHAARS